MVYVVLYPGSYYMSYNESPKGIKAQKKKIERERDCGGTEITTTTTAARCATLNTTRSMCCIRLNYFFFLKIYFSFLLLLFRSEDLLFIFGNFLLTNDWKQVPKKICFCFASGEWLRRRTNRQTTAPFFRFLGGLLLLLLFFLNIYENVWFITRPSSRWWGMSSSVWCAYYICPLLLFLSLALSLTRAAIHCAI